MYIIFKYITDRIIIIETKFLNNIFQYRYVFFKCSLNIPLIVHTENVDFLSSVWSIRYKLTQ